MAHKSHQQPRELLTSGWIRLHCDLPLELIHLIQSFARNAVEWLIEDHSLKDVYITSSYSRFQHGDIADGITKLLLMELHFKSNWCDLTLICLSN